MGKRIIQGHGRNIPKKDHTMSEHQPVTNIQEASERQEGVELMADIASIITYMNSRNKIIQSDPILSIPIKAAVDSVVEFDVVLTDGQGAVNLFNNDMVVTVAVTGSASLVDGSSVTLTAGRATVKITNAVAETVTVSFGDIDGLDTSGTVIVDFIEGEN